MRRPPPAAQPRPAPRRAPHRAPETSRSSEARRAGPHADWRRGGGLSRGRCNRRTARRETGPFEGLWEAIALTSPLNSCSSWLQPHAPVPETRGPRSLRQTEPPSSQPSPPSPASPHSRHAAHPGPAAAGRGSPVPAGAGGARRRRRPRRPLPGRDRAVRRGGQGWCGCAVVCSWCRSAPRIARKYCCGPVAVAAVATTVAAAASAAADRLANRQQPAPPASLTLPPGLPTSPPPCSSPT